MAITFDHEKELSNIIYWDESASEWITTNYCDQTDFDYFDDDATVGDALYFGWGYSYGNKNKKPQQSFHDIKFYVGTPLVADSITVAWEYWNGSAWVAIPGLVDNTNAFQNAGENWVTFPVPPSMRPKNDLTGSTYGRCVWVRCRITALTNLTEGGAQSNQTVKVKDWTIDFDTSVRLSDLKDASDSGGWGVVDKLGEKAYLIKAHIRAKNGGTLTIKDGEQLQLGHYDGGSYYNTFFIDSGGTIQFGELDADGFGINGGSIYHTTFRREPYNYIKGSFKFYASVYYHHNGSFGDPAFGNPGLIDIRDSVLNGNSLFYFVKTASGSKLHRTHYSVSEKLYQYSENLDINGLTLAKDCEGILSGKDANISNVEFSDTQQLIVYYNSLVNLYDCIIQNDNITFYWADTNDRVYKYFHFNLKVIDKDGNGIEGATVKIWDKTGALVVNATTDTNGTLPEQTLKEIYVHYDNNASPKRTETYYTPHTIEISKPGYQTYRKKFTVNKKIDWLIRLIHSNVCVDQEVMLP